MRSRLIGFVILVLIVGVALTVFFMQGGGKKQLTLKGFIGGEKAGLLEDNEVKKILKSRYGITLNYSKAGSIDMVKEEVTTDFLFPSSQIALEIFKDTKGQKLVKSEVIFNSPIVLYSWDLVTDALIKQGVVEKRDNSYYIVDFPKLVDMVIQGKKWSDIGLGELYGSMTIISTDPTKSNSGNMFSGLMANILNGDVVDDKSVETILPKLKQFTKKQGFLEHSSSDLFEQYLKTGVGAKPIIVGYENQIIEFASQNPELWKSVKDRVRILYPVPTVWSAHPLISLNANASELISALEDRDIQKIAWEKHGFRTGFAGAENNTKVIQVMGLPDRIDKVIPMPNHKVMDRIIQALQEK